MLCGGSWYYFPKDLRSASRDWDFASERNDDAGFQVARDLSAITP